MRFIGRLICRGGGFFAALFVATSSGATEPCGICDERVVTNSALAQCFLDEYPFLADKAGTAIVVDLSKCEQDRSIVAPLAAPGREAVEPSTTFMVTKPQLDCLKAKLEEPGLQLDPSATIELDGCG